MGSCAGSLARGLASPLRRTGTLLHESGTGVGRVRRRGRESVRRLPFGALSASSASREGVGQDLRGRGKTTRAASVSGSHGDSFAALSEKGGLCSVPLLQGIRLRSAG